MRNWQRHTGESDGNSSSHARGHACLLDEIVRDESQRGAGQPGFNG
jgi:hypothetical protein